MRIRWAQIIGLLLLCIYAVAIVHQVMPHDGCHGQDDSCCLCAMLFGVVVLAGGTILLLPHFPSMAELPCYLSPHTRPSWTRLLLRGPPCF